MTSASRNMFMCRSFCAVSCFWLHFSQSWQGSLFCWQSSENIVSCRISWASSREMGHRQLIHLWQVSGWRTMSLKFSNLSVSSQTSRCRVTWTWRPTSHTISLMVWQLERHSWLVQQWAPSPPSPSCCMRSPMRSETLPSSSSRAAPRRR